MNKLKKHLIKATSGSFLIKIFSIAFSIISGIVLARTLGTSGYGIYAFTMSLTSLLSIPTTMGMEQVLVRKIPVYKTQLNWNFIKGIMFKANQICFFVSIGLIIVVSIWFALVKPSDPIINIQTINAGLFLVFLMPMARISMSSLRGFKKITLSQLPEFVIKPIFFVVLLLCFYLWNGNNLSPFQAMSCMVLATGFCFIAARLFIQREIPRVVKQATPEFETRKWVKNAIPLLMIGAMQFIVRETDILMLGALANVEDVGIYRVAQRLANLVPFSLAAVNMVVGPTFSELYYQNRLHEIQKVILKSTGAIFLFSVPIALMFIFAGEYIITFIFGQNFSVAASPLALLSVAQIVNVSFGSIGVLLIMSGHERDSFVGLAVSCLFNIFLNAWLIPIYNVQGAAIATGISIIIWNLILGSFVFKRLHIYPGLFGLLKTADK